ncbi:YdcF family protein [Clostridium algoriphilum]|uniref:YdcF family protein n=1 Tax=Clostridium algoriphilum TaxID=198347 RepID=UPI001CF3580C|nr:YdcF family protein [Clostridium algoriphilum]MCB2295495.1 YdcF family protein [Clostridium algoriphilum]
MSYPFDCISDLIFVDTYVQKADVILVPGTNQPQLMELAAELYHKGFAPYILPTGGVNPNIDKYDTEWEYLKMIGIKLGVPEGVILKEDKARNTFENARLSWKILNENNISIKKVILVCKSYHSRRALLTYQLAFPLSVDFYVSTVTDKTGVTKDNWFLNSEYTSLIMGEIVKIGEYFKDEIPNLINNKSR